MVLGLLIAVPMLLWTSERPMGEMTQPWVRNVSTALCCLMLLGVALSAATRISREREQQTLDGLLVLPIGAVDIVLSKWLASILSVRWLFLPLIGTWLFGVFTGGLSAFAIPWLAAAWLAYAGFIAAVGIFFSATSTTTLRAFLLTLMVGLLFICGPGTIYRAIRGEAAPGPAQSAWFMALIDYGLTPPMTLAGLSFRSQDLWLERPGSFAELPHYSSYWTELVAALFGLQAYLLLTALIVFLIWYRFERERGPRPQFQGLTYRLPSAPR
jgi:ABC-type transport system involved in multi-copper enzyme maturation permease subunit